MKQFFYIDGMDGLKCIYFNIATIVAVKFDGQGVVIETTNGRIYDLRMGNAEQASAALMKLLDQYGQP